MSNLKDLLLQEDINFLNKLEEEYQDKKTKIENAISNLDTNYNILKKGIRELNKLKKEVVKDFAEKNVDYLRKVYDINFEKSLSETIKKIIEKNGKIDFEIILNKILNEEKFSEEYKEKVTDELRRELKYIIVDLKNKDKDKLVLNNYVEVEKKGYLDTKRVTGNKLKLLFKILGIFLTNQTRIPLKLAEIELKGRRGDEEFWKKHQVDIKEINWIRVYKNGNLKIRFRNSEIAKEFLQFIKN